MYIAMAITMGMAIDSFITFISWIMSTLTRVREYRKIPAFNLGSFHMVELVGGGSVINGAYPV